MQTPLILFFKVVTLTSFLFGLGCYDAESVNGKSASDFEQQDNAYASQTPHQLLQLSPDDKVEIQLAGERLIVRAYHYQKQDDFRMPISIYSVDLGGNDPQLLSTELDNVLVLRNGLVLGYESGDQGGASVYYLDPSGQTQPSLFVDNVYPVLMSETDYGLIVFHAVSDITDAALLSIYPSGESGLGSPKSYEYTLLTHRGLLTSDTRHFVAREFRGYDVPSRLFWFDLSTFQEHVLEEAVTNYAVAPNGPYVVWANEADELHVLDLHTGDTRLLLEGGAYQEYGTQTGEYYYSLEFTLNGLYLIFLSGYLLDLASGTIVPLPDFGSYDSEIGLIDGVEQAMDLLEDGSLMLGIGADPNSLEWIKFDTDMYESVRFTERLQLFTDFSYHNDRLFALEPFEMNDWGEGRLLQTSVNGGDFAPVVERVDMRYQWISANRLLTHINQEEFRVEIKENSGVVMARGDLEVIDVATDESLLLDKNVNVSNTVLFLDQRFVAYTVANHKNRDRSGVYTVALPAERQ